MNLDPQSMGLILGCVTLATLVWKMGATNALFTESVKALNKEVSELKEIRKDVQLIPLLLQRVEQLEKFTSSFPRQLRDQRDAEEKAVARKSGAFG